MANVPISAFTVPANTVGIGATGYSLTGSASASFMDLAGTWNTSGTPTAIKLNITDTASNAASLLMDLQVGGASQFKVSKFGTAHVNGGIYVNSDIGVQVLTNSGAFVLGASQDLFLGRNAAASLRLGAADAAAPVAQTLGVQSVVAGTTNTAGTNFTIKGSAGTGTGAGGSIIFQVAPAGSSGSAQNALVDVLVANSARYTIMYGEGTSSGSYISQFRDSAGTIKAWVNGAGGFAGTTGAFSSAVTLTGNLLIFGSSQATRLQADADNTLALRNGTAAQTFNVYNTYTDASNYERGFARWSSNVFQIGTEKSGTGAARAIEFQTDGTTRLTIATTGAATISGAANTANLLTISSTHSGFNGIFLQNTNSTASGAASTGFTTQNDSTAQLITRVYGTGVTASTAWGITLANYAGVFATGAASNGLMVGTLTATPIIFGTSTTEQMRITSGGLVTFGGTTSSFPALKRNSTALETKLADDSAYAPHAMQYLDVTDGITAPASATGRARIYVDTADGDLKVIFADGTVKTIVTDT